MKAVCVCLLAGACLLAHGQIEFRKGSGRGSGGAKPPVAYRPGTVPSHEANPAPRPAPAETKGAAQVEHELSAKSISQATRDVNRPQAAKTWWWQQTLFGIGAALALFVAFRAVMDKFVPKPQ